MAIHSIPNMFKGWHIWWVCWPCKNWNVFSFRKLCADPCNIEPYIQYDTNKMHLRLLPITCAGHSIQNTDINKLLTHMTPNKLIHLWREDLSNMPDAMECERLPTQVSCSEVKAPMRPMSMQMSFPEMVSNNLWIFIFLFTILKIFLSAIFSYSGDLIPFRKCWSNDFHTSGCWRNSRVPVTTAGQAGSEPVVMDAATRF